MKITQVTKEMVGKKITCKIHDVVISDAKIQTDGSHFYICQNYKDGLDVSDKLGYKCSWSIDKGAESELKGNNVRDLVLTNEVIDDYIIY